MEKQYSRITLILAMVFVVGSSYAADSKTAKAQARVSLSGIQPAETQILVAGACKISSLQESLLTLWPLEVEHGQRRPPAVPESKLRNMELYRDELDKNLYASLQLPGIKAQGSVRVLTQGTFLCRPGPIPWPPVDYEFRALWGASGTIGGDPGAKKDGAVFWVPQGYAFTVPKGAQLVAGVGLWLPGATHVLFGEIKDLGASGYVFTSNSAYPLHFKLIKKTGYVYLCGKGTVRTPSGQTHTLGAGQTREKWIASLSDTDALNRESAARALAWLGDASSIKRLQALLGKEKNEVVKLAMQDSIEDLRKKHAPSVPQRAKSAQ